MFHASKRKNPDSNVYAVRGGSAYSEWDLIREGSFINNGKINNQNLFLKNQLKKIISKEIDFIIFSSIHF